MASKRNIKWKTEVLETFEFDTNNWSKETTTYGKDFKTVYLYCGNRASTNCEMELRVTSNQITGNITNISSSGSHSTRCQTNPLKITIEMKDRVKKSFESGVHRPREILRNLKDEFPDININYIYNQVKILKKTKEIMNRNFSSVELEELCQKYIYKDNQTPYIIGFDKTPTRVLTTSDKLLEHLSISENVHLDATYKLNAYGFPVIVVGISDLDRKFFVTAIAIVEKEDTETYNWIIQMLFEKIKCRPDFIASKNFIGDNAKQITSAVSVYGNNSLRTNCWSHTARLMKNILAKLPEDFKNEAMQEIYFLQALTTKSLFEEGLELFKTKYSNFAQTREFIKIFEENYIVNNGNWFEAYDIWNPSTNNALERFNLLIKDKYTEWVRCDFPTFISKCLEIMIDFSLKVPRFDKMFYTAKDKSKTKNEFAFLKADEYYKYYIIKKKNVDIEELRSLFNSKFKTLIDFVFFYSSLTFLKVKHDIKRWNEISCSCHDFAKMKKCGHIFSYLEEVQKIHLIEKPLMSIKIKRGRRKKVKPNTSLKIEKEKDF